MDGNRIAHWQRDPAIDNQLFINFRAEGDLKILAKAVQQALEDLQRCHFQSPELAVFPSRVAEFHAPGDWMSLSGLGRCDAGRISPDGMRPTAGNRQRGKCCGCSLRVLGGGTHAAPNGYRFPNFRASSWREIWMRVDLPAGQQ
jgi:hypothetical protein